MACSECYTGCEDGVMSDVGRYCCGYSSCIVSCQGLKNASKKLRVPVERITNTEVPRYFYLRVGDGHGVHQHLLLKLVQRLHLGRHVYTSKTSRFPLFFSSASSRFNDSTIGASLFACMGQTSFFLGTN